MARKKNKSKMEKKARRRAESTETQEGGWSYLWFVLIALIAIGAAEIGGYLEDGPLHVIVDNEQVDGYMMDMVPIPTFTISEYFSKEISKYEEHTLNFEMNCTSGTCPEIKLEVLTVEKGCHFCNTTPVENLQLRLFSDGEGGQESDHGCVKGWQGPTLNGFKVIEALEDRIRAVGDVQRNYAQRGRVCDKSSDPECDDKTYGDCEGGDYAYTTLRTVEMTFVTPG